MESTLELSPRGQDKAAGSASVKTESDKASGLRRRLEAPPAASARSRRASRGDSRPHSGPVASVAKGPAAETGKRHGEGSAPPAAPSRGVPSKLLLLATAAALATMAILMARRSAERGGPSQPVRVIVQLSQVEGQHSLPEGESPESLLRLLRRHSRHLAFELPGSGGANGSGLVSAKQVYISIGSFNRLDEMVVDRRQVSEAGQIDGFLFVWMTSLDQCREGYVTEDHREYVHEKLGLDAQVGFICYWDGFLDAKLTQESLAVLDSALTASR